MPFGNRNSTQEYLLLFEKVTGSQSMDSFWVSGREIIYSTFGDSTNPAALWTFDLQTQRTRMIHATGDIPLGRGLAVSPEGNSVYFVQLDRWQSNIVVADYEVVK